MRKFINSCLKELRLSSVVESTILGNDIKFYRVVAKGCNGKFYLCEIFFNDADVFMLNPQQSNLLGNLNNLSLKDKILLSVRIYDDIKDCFSNSLGIETVNKLDSYISEYLSLLSSRIMDLSDDTVNIIKVNIYNVPTFIVCILYSVDGVVQVPIKMFIGKRIDPRDYRDSCEYFIEELNSLVGGDSFVK